MMRYTAGYPPPPPPSGAVSSQGETNRWMTSQPQTVSLSASAASTVSPSTSASSSTASASQQYAPPTMPPPPLGAYSAPPTAASATNRSPNLNPSSLNPSNPYTPAPFPSMYAQSSSHSQAGPPPLYTTPGTAAAVPSSATRGRPVSIDTSLASQTQQSVPPTAAYGLPRTTSFDRGSFTQQPSPTERAPNSNGSGGSGGRRHTSRIDPGQMPRPDKPPVDVIFHTKSGSSRKNPPSANAVFTCIDTGNASPRHVRCTTVAPPFSKDLLQQTGLPFALHVTPFANVEEGEDAVPEVNFGQSPPRCHSCRAYINGSVTWLDNGKKWLCNLCNSSNSVPDWYYSSLDSSGMRIDRNTRPELIRGSVDFIVGDDYSVQPLQHPVIVFAVDISVAAISCGAAMASIRAIKKAVDHLKARIEQLQGQQSQWGDADFSISRIGIVTFDAALQFYDVELTCFDPVRMCVCDPDDPFPVLPEKRWLFDVLRDYQSIDVLLKKLPDIIGSGAESSASRRSQPVLCPNAALKAIQQGLNSIGGKVFLFSTFHSTKGYAPLTFDRRLLAEYGSSEEILLYSTPDKMSLYATPTPRALKSVPSAGNLAPKVASNAPIVPPLKLQTAACKSRIEQLDELKSLKDSCEEFCKDCQRSRVAVNAYAFTETSMPCLDLTAASSRPLSVGDDANFFDGTFLGELTMKTGGRFSLFKGSMILEDNLQRLERQLLHDIDAIVGSDSAWKLRSSAGIVVDNYIGPGEYAKLEDEVWSAAVDRHSTAMFSLAHSASNLKEEDRVHFQLAVLYTAWSTVSVVKKAIRRVRVHNLMLFVTAKPPVVFRNCDIEAVLASFIKMSLQSAFSFSLSDEKNGPKTKLQNSIFETLLRYRKLCSPQSPKGQLVLPESLKVLPVYTLGMLKHTALIENSINGQGNLNPQSTTSAPSPRNRFRTGGSSSITATLSCGTDRGYELRKLLTQPLKEILNSVYPRLYNLFNMLEGDLLVPGTVQTLSESSISPAPSSTGSNVGLPLSRIPSFTNGTPGGCGLYGFNGNTSGGGSGNSINAAPLSEIAKQKRLLINTLHCTAEVFESDQIYVLDDRTTIWLYIGRSIPQDLLEELFILPGHTPYDRPEFLSVRESSPLGQKVFTFLRLLSLDSPCQQEMRVIWADLHNGNPAMAKFTSRLVEDSQTGMMSYVDYLCHIHSKIQSKL